MARKSAQQKKAMIEALTEARGIVSTACVKAGVGRRTHYQWLKKDPEYKEAVDDLHDVVLDFAEDALHRLIKNGDTTATIFLLKTLGKRRGYIERTEHDIGNSQRWDLDINLIDAKNAASFEQGPI